MKEKMKKLSDACKYIFGYGIMLVLFVGGMLFFGYVAALIIGGEVAELICFFLYKKIAPAMIYTTTLLVLLGLVSMYLAGEKALTSERDKSSKETKR